MSSLTQALSIALTGLQTSTALISMTSNNISNANTAGYTAKTATVTAVDLGAQFGGVQIATYQRASNLALTTDYNNATSAASYTATQNTYMTQLQSVLNSSSTNPTLSADVANFSAAWSTYSSDPEDNSSQLAVINSAQTLTNDIQVTEGGVAALQVQVQSDVQTGVTTLNADLKQIASLNSSIMAASTAGLQTVDLQDQMDTLVNKVSSLMNVSVQARDNGQIALYTPSGQLLVDDQTAKSFTFNGTTISDAGGTNVTSALSGGSLQAALDFISTSPTAASSTTPGVGVIAKFKSQLSTLVTAFTGNSSSFVTAYGSAVTASTASGATQSGETLASSLFTVITNSSGLADPSTFAVNTAILNGTSDLPQSGSLAIANSFNSTATYTASGLSVGNVTYAGLTSAILSSFQQTANTISSESATATSQQSYYQQSLSDKTGVNTDTELANLVTYQNSYAASAHVLSTVNQMLTTLMSVIS